MQNIQIKLGDCIDIMSEMRDNSIDSIVTDPPAGIAFMGKDWDKDKGGRDEWIEWMTQVASECLRVIKPGGHAFVWALPRTSHWTATAWENAGFEVRDRIEHIFGSGFPKSLNIKKQIEKEWKCKLEKVTVNNVIDLLYQNTGLKEMGGQDFVAENVWGIIKKEESIELVKNVEKNFLFLNVTLKEKIEEIKGVFVATFVNLNGKNSLQVNLIIIGEGESLLGQTDMWLLTSEMENIDSNMTLLWKKLLEEELLPMKTFTTIAKLEQIIDLKIWNSLQYRNTLNYIASAGTALKPSVEDWWLFRKPLSEKTVTENVLKWGTGAINIDASRVPLEENSRLEKGGSYSGNRTGSNEKSLFNGGNGKIEYSNPPGRWPAQVVHDGSEEVVSLFPETKSGGGDRRGTHSIFGNVGDSDIKRVFDSNSGSAARFFYCAKASGKERNNGLDELEEKQMGRNQSSLDGGKILTGSGNERSNHKKNHHPTVKPLALMRYLITLVTPPNGIVLDPFLGSGTTLVAVKELGFSGRGIENNPEYFEIAKARIENVVYTT